MEIHYTHPFKENITTIMDNLICNDIQSDESNGEYDVDETEGLYDGMDLMDISDFSNAEKHIRQYIENYGYAYEPADEFSDTQWGENFRIRLAYTLEWNEKSLVLKYQYGYFYLLDDNGTQEFDVADDFSYYIEEVLAKHGFVFKYKKNTCDCSNPPECKECNGRKIKFI